MLTDPKDILAFASLLAPFLIAGAVILGKRSLTRAIGMLAAVGLGLLLVAGGLYLYANALPLHSSQASAYSPNVQGRALALLWATTILALGLNLQVGATVLALWSASRRSDWRWAAALVAFSLLANLGSASLPSGYLLPRLLHLDALLASLLRNDPGTTGSYIFAVCAVIAASPLGALAYAAWPRSRHGGEREPATSPHEPARGEA